MKKEVPPANGSVDIVLLDGGGFRTGSDRMIHADGHDEPFFMYDWCFYIHHKATGRKMLWDLGMSDDASLYTPYVLKNAASVAQPVGPRCSLENQLKALGVEAGEIDTIMFSHAHWDHCRPAKGEFPNAKVFFGPGTGDYCRPGHIQDGQVLETIQWDGRIFSDDPSIQSDPYEEIGGPWKAWGPFDAAVDYFKDGSFWVVQSPGHMPGNLSACARLPNGEYVVLGSDCCHSRAIFDGSREIAQFKLPNGTMFCLHHDLDKARDTIGKLRDAVHTYGMHLALAHDPEFIREGSDETLAGILHPLLRSEECVGRIRAGKRP